MQIQLKQTEIEAALKGYLANQGIVVAGKQVTMDFTAGRKNKGISVEVVIEDATPVAAADVALDIQDSMLQAAQTDLGSADPFQELVADVPSTEADQVEVEKPATTSLFG